jgi:hypothetical protein
MTQARITVRMQPAELAEARALAEARGVTLPTVVRAGLQRFAAAERTRAPERSIRTVMTPRLQVRLTRAERKAAETCARARGVTLAAIVRAGLRCWMTDQKTRQPQGAR